MMRVRWMFRKPMILSGALTLGYFGARAFFNTLPGADARFFDWTGPTHEIELDDLGKLTTPIRYYRTDAFLGVFSAAYDPVKDALPTPDLYPVKLSEDRAALAIMGLNYTQMETGYYGEVIIGAFCTFGQEAPAVLPLLLESHYPGFGIFVFHMPVTTQSARDGGRKYWGYPKFLANMAFEQHPTHQSVKLSEGDAHILTLSVKQRGFTLRDSRPVCTYTVLDGDLIKTCIPSRSIYQLALRPGSGTLELGSHAITHQLREFEISETAILTRNYLNYSSLLPLGLPIARVTRPYPGHTGEDREFARMTVSYDPHRAPVDVHIGWESETVT